jgi:hypothetical protein
VCPSIGTTDGEPMNAMHDYVIRMTPGELPPATAFWSATLYDTANGFFMRTIARSTASAKTGHETR